MNNNKLDQLNAVESTSEYKEHLAVVRQRGIAIKYIPEEFKTEEMCLVAVRKNSHALRFVPEELKTEEMCLIALPKSSSVSWWEKYSSTRYRGSLPDKVLRISPFTIFPQSISILAPRALFMMGTSPILSQYAAITGEWRTS